MVNTAGQIETIQAIYDAISSHGVPDSEELDLLDGEGNNLGRCLSMIGLIVTAEKNTGKPVWLSRDSGEHICSLRFQGENQYEITPV